MKKTGLSALLLMCLATGVGCDTSIEPNVDATHNVKNEESKSEIKNNIRIGYDMDIHENSWGILKIKMRSTTKWISDYYLLQLKRKEGNEWVNAENITLYTRDKNKKELEYEIPIEHLNREYRLVFSEVLSDNLDVKIEDLKLKTLDDVKVKMSK